MEGHIALVHGGAVILTMAALAGSEQTVTTFAGATYMECLRHVTHHWRPSQKTCVCRLEAQGSQCRRVVLVHGRQELKGQHISHSPSKMVSSEMHFPDSFKDPGDRHPTTDGCILV